MRKSCPTQNPMVQRPWNMFYLLETIIVQNGCQFCRQAYHSLLSSSARCDKWLCTPEVTDILSWSMVSLPTTAWLTPVMGESADRQAWRGCGTVGSSDTFPRKAGLGVCWRRHTSYSKHHKFDNVTRTSSANPPSCCRSRREKSSTEDFNVKELGSYLRRLSWHPQHRSPSTKIKQIKKVITTD